MSGESGPSTASCNCKQHAEEESRGETHSLLGQHLVWGRNGPRYLDAAGSSQDTVQVISEPTWVTQREAAGATAAKTFFQSISCTCTVYVFDRSAHPCANGPLSAITPTLE